MVIFKASQLLPHWEPVGTLLDTGSQNFLNIKTLLCVTISPSDSNISTMQFRYMYICQGAVIVGIYTVKQHHGIPGLQEGGYYALSHQVAIQGRERCGENMDSIMLSRYSHVCYAAMQLCSVYSGDRFYMLTCVLPSTLVCLHPHLMSACV